MKIKKQTKGERRKAEIIQIGTDVLINKGYEAFSLRDIAAQADMKLGNLQYYFSSKELLLEAIIRAEAHKDLELIVAEISNAEDSKAQILSFCDAIIKRWLGDSGKIFVLMSFLSHQSPTFMGLYKEIYSAFYKALTPILESLDPNQHAETYLRRAMLITALIDGAPAQPRQGDFEAFIHDVSEHAYKIAVGE